jgi:Flp pilus assembly protein TadD
MRSLLIAFVCLAAGHAVAQQRDPASRVYEQASKSVFLIVIRSAAGEPIARGSGFLIADNKIITNQHVVREGNPFLDLGAVKLPLRIEKVDSINDLAIVTVDGELSVPALELSAAEPSPGTSIFAIGNPAGLEKSISSGVVAGIRQMSGRELIQISAPISPGSSGGPILNSKSEVIAVAVGILEEGQNLNFGVPSKFIQKLLSGATDQTDIPTLFTRVDDIFTNRNKGEYSAEPDSPWMKGQREMEGLLRQALALAGKNAPALKSVADKVLGFTFWTMDPTIAVDASERLVQIKPTSEAYSLLAESLQAAAGDETPTDKDSATRKKAERAIQSAFASTKQPTVEMYALLADILEDRELTAESKVAFLKAHEMAKARNDASQSSSALRGLIRTSASMSNNAENDRWFKALVDSGAVTEFDRDAQARRLYKRGDNKGAGDNFALAASAAWWSRYCDAATAYAVDNKDPDRILAMARACVANGANKKDSDSQLANAHRQIADVLNTRGVYEEALSQAREALVLLPQDAFEQDTLAEALTGLRRFQEAINAAKQAIRLSDGKYSWMHFRLGSAYFEIENWELSRQSFEKASQLNPKDAEAAYNVAICLVRLGLTRDAATWYEESLKRNPNQANRQEILTQIQALRK